ncbi:UbiA prenyltransferase family-domain-containing protein [Mycena maculata]|uniref:Protoheme IX farnesyltransferase, mitochondrial n=1 Tax=Mycena maculata TaxID=230809 RepID=A0AAD7HS29_9AGAR|nr:UbiA prenyltransferase family-domain-containing protein [Mycena maculata]
MNHVLRPTPFFLKSFRQSNSFAVAAYKPLESLRNPTNLLKNYAQLSKSRLTLLMVLTAMSGVAISPLPTTVPVLLSTALGTALCSASANTLNQLQEIPFDAQMARTRMRPLVRRSITPLHAAGFALVTGVAGPAILWAMTNPTTALLGAANIGLYAGVYTWMKRQTIWNTWVGSVVGAIPPVMGWTACGGHLIPTASNPVQLFFPPFMASAPLPDLADNPLAPIALFALLFSWQFPHFHPLSHLMRSAYAQAGYQMLSVLSPRKNSLVALRHAVLLFPICSVLIPLSGLTTWTFALTSLLPNLIWTHATWRFWRVGGDKEARVAWRHGLWWLPVILALMMVHKQGVNWTQWLGFREAEEEDSDSS